jgi:hypothetical protein
LIHLSGAGQTRFVQNVETLLPIVWFVAR